MSHVLNDFAVELTFLPAFDVAGHPVSHAARSSPSGTARGGPRGVAARPPSTRDAALSALAHEIRQPLHVILGYADLLASSLPDLPTSEPRVFAERILQTTTYLARLVDDMLDLARAGSGGLPLRHERFDATVLVREVAAAYLPAATARGLTLECVTPAHAIEIVSDRGRLRQVLSNLVDNAVKYTPSGNVTVQAACRGGKIVFAIQDTGIGIAAKDLRRAFEEFERLEAAIAQGDAGWGIGLTMVRRLVDLLGGRLDAASTPGHGSRFVVRLPRSPVPPHPPEAA